MRVLSALLVAVLSKFSSNATILNFKLSSFFIDIKSLMVTSFNEFMSFIFIIFFEVAKYFIFFEISELYFIENKSLNILTIQTVTQKIKGCVTVCRLVIFLILKCKFGFVWQLRTNYDREKYKVWVHPF